MTRTKTLTLAALLALPATWAMAQQPSTDSADVQSTTQRVDDDDDTDLGWIGLLGLAGLLGLKRKDRDEVIRTPNRTS